MNPYDLNSPDIITPSGDFMKKPAGAKPIASPRKDSNDGKVCDPNDLFNYRVVTIEEVREGDFISYDSIFPKRVGHIDQTADGPILYLQRIYFNEFNALKKAMRVDNRMWSIKGRWVIYPNLAKLWKAAHDK